MTEPIKLPINVTAGDLRGLDTIKERLRELRKLGHMEFTQGMRELIQEVRQAKGVASTAMSEAFARAQPAPGVSSSLGGTAPAPSVATSRRGGRGASPQDLPGGFWRRIRPGGAIRPVQVSPAFGPHLPQPTALEQAHALQFTTPWSPLAGVRAQLQAQQAAARTARMQQAQTQAIAAQMLGQPTALEQAHALQFTTPWSPLAGAAAQVRAQQAAARGARVQGAQTQAIAAQMLGQQTPLQQAHALQFTTPWSPIAGAAAQVRAQQAAARGARVQQVQTQAIAAQMLGQQTPLQQAHALQFTTPWSPIAGAAAQVRAQQAAARGARVQQAQVQAIAAQMLAQQTPLQQAHALQFTTPWSPLASQHAQLLAQQAATRQGGARQAQLMSLVAQMGPPPPPGGYRPTFGAGGSWGERVGMGIENTVAFGARGAAHALGIAGRGLGAAYGAVHGPARAAMGAVAGIGIYQVITQSMQLYEQRAKAVIDLGMRQGREFDAIGDSIDTLRGKYHVLAQDSIAAIGVMSRVAGPAATRAWLEPSVAHGLAVGLTAPESAEIAGRLSRFTTGREPMGQILSAARRSYGSRDLDQLMEPASQLEEASRMAALHGGQGIAAPAGLYGGLLGFFGRMGEQYMAPGEATGAYARMSAGLAPSGNQAIEAQRFLAVDELRRSREARGLGSIIRRGKDTFDLSTHVGKLAYMEQAGQDPELMEAFRQRALTLAQGNPQHEQLLGQQVVFGGKLSMIETMRQMREAQEVGGFQHLPFLAPGGVDAQKGEAEAALAARENRPEFVHAIRLAVAEAHLEKIGEPIVKAADQLTMALIRVADGLGDNGLAGGMSELKAAVASIETPTKQIASALLMLGSNSWAGVALGALVGGGTWDDMFNQALRTYNNPVTNSLADFNEWLMRNTGGSPRQPTTPSK